MTHIETLKLALSVCVEATWALAHACEKNPVYGSAYDKLSDLTPRLRQTIEQAEQAQPVAYSVGRTLHWHEGMGVNDAQLYTAPPRQPLTDEECDRIYNALDEWSRYVDECDFGLPSIAGGGFVTGRKVIRQAIEATKGVKGEA